MTGWGVRLHPGRRNGREKAEGRHRRRGAASGRKRLSTMPAALHGGRLLVPGHLRPPRLVL
jgi:hypothetical protein